MVDAAAPAAPPAEAASKKPEAKPRFTARLRYARISERKMRYVVDLIRGKDYNSAVSILRSCSKRGAMYVKKLLESVFGNAADQISNKQLDIDVNKLHLVEARVDPGPIIKRWRASSQRRPLMIQKRMCHVFLALEERELKESRKERTRRQKQERQRKASAGKAAAAPKPAAKPEGESKKEETK
ncbi:MAG TPA: 50S ribosomal protein L22 [Planctomycetota bacterium]|nr:50S ribosomal protein L22 [Planctomycetota bacterium]